MQKIPRSHREPLFRVETALVLAALAAAVPHAAAQTSRDAGYDVEKSQSVQNAPAGYVGRKTTDREHRVGYAEDTLGNESTSSITFGGFAKRCPTSEGVVDGNFEFTLVSDEVNTNDDGEIQRTHYRQSLVVTLEGHVLDDAKLDSIEITGGQFTRERSGTNMQTENTRSAVPNLTFRPGPSGEPDWAAMRRMVEATAEIATAAIVPMAGAIYKDAELVWNKPDPPQCAEFSFDPPTETLSMRANQSAEVRTELRPKAGGGAVGGAQLQANALQGIGTLRPHEGRTQDDMPFTFTYTASANPKAGHGFDVAARSRAGVALGKWVITEGQNYDLEFESTIISRDIIESVRSHATARIRLTGANGTSRLSGEERRLYNGAGKITYTTTPLPERDPCDPLVQGQGTTDLTVVDAHIDVTEQRDANGAPIGGQVQIEMPYGVTFSFGGGETINQPLEVDFRCFVRPERAQPHAFWVPAFVSGRDEDGQTNLLSKDGWTYVGRDGVVATKTLRSSCGGVCDEEVTKLTLREVEPAPSR